MADTQANVTKEAAKEAAQKKSYIRTLTSGNERLQFNAIGAKNSVSFYILHQQVEGQGDDRKVKTIERGESQKFNSMEEAAAYVDKAVDMALKDGWTAPARVGGGFTRTKQDTFTLSSLPKPKGTPMTETPVAASQGGQKDPNWKGNPQGGNQKGATQKSR